jgi:hypothetical protein
LKGIIGTREKENKEKGENNTEIKRKKQKKKKDGVPNASRGKK